ncbi:MAG: hypothetical protein WBD28_12250 [Candidatus Zixiibacteriota bacterium]
MKSQRFSFMALSVGFMLFFIILVLIGYSQTPRSDLTKSHEMLREIFPNSKISWSEEIDTEFVNFKATPTSIIISRKKDEEKCLKYINFENGISWEIDSENFPYKFYYLVGGAEQRILAENPKHEGLVETNVFDQTGRYLFKARTISTLQSSPNGIYYHTVGSMTSYNELKLFNAEGQFLWSQKISGMDWFAEALSDSELICEGSDGCCLLDAFSGEEIWRVSRKQYNHILPGYKLKHILPSSNGKYFVLFHGDGIISLDREGRILWLKGMPGTVLFAAISDDGKFVAVYSRERIGHNGVKVALLDNLDQGRIIWSRSVKTEKKDGTSNIGGLKITKDIVRLIPGIVPYHIQAGVMSDMQTFFYQIDTGTGKLINEFILPGVAEIVEDENETKHFLLLETTTEKGIYKISEVLVE